jgi:predicted alpha/beta hydrolase family esterase
MTKQILFIQGGGAGAHDEWDNKLVASAILIGHSVGGTILIHALAEQAPERPLAGVFLSDACLSLSRQRR